MTHQPKGGTRAWLVWSAALVAYAIGVWHRTSFGVAAVDAAERFDVGAAILATFVMVQLGVYAAMQVPAGLLLDRFGSRALIGVGALVMAVGQLLLALTDALPMAYLARVLIGAGDAATFVSLVRLVALWFPPRRIPVVTQLSGILGQAGQVASAFVLVPVLHGPGWTTAFGGLAAIGVFAGLLALAAVRDSPDGRVPPAGGGFWAPIRGSARELGTWLGLTSHALAQFPLNVFVMLWGYPFLRGEGLSASVAGAVLTAAVLSGVVSGPLIGVFSARHPLRRSWVVLGSATATAVAWAAVLLGPEPAPVWLLAVLAAVLGIGGPASLVGFDFARTFNPPARLGTATGLVNTGGFVLAVLVLLTIGLILDAAPGPALNPDAFRSAFAVQGVFWLGCLVAVLLTRRALRRELAADGVVVPPVRAVLARRRGGRAVEGLADTDG